MKILLVDDSRTMRNLQKRALTALTDVEFREAGDGIEALACMEKDTFELALVDWNMPNMDGLTLVKRVRTTNKAVRLIMVTTEADMQCAAEAIRAGVNDYLIKPFTAEGLLARVQLSLKSTADA